MPSWSGTSALRILTSRTKPSVSTEMRRFLPRRKLGAVVAPRFAATPESELSVLVNVYAYLIKSHNSKKDAQVAQLDTGKLKDSIRGEEAEMT